MHDAFVWVKTLNLFKTIQSKQIIVKFVLHREMLYPVRLNNPGYGRILLFYLRWETSVDGFFSVLALRTEVKPLCEQLWNKNGTENKWQVTKKTLWLRTIIWVADVVVFKSHSSSKTKRAAFYTDYDTGNSEAHNLFLGTFDVSFSSNASVELQI